MPIKTEMDDWDPLEFWPRKKELYCENFGQLLSSLTADNSFNLTEFLANSSDVIDNKKYEDVIDSKIYDDIAHTKIYDDIAHSKIYDDIAHSKIYDDIVHSKIYDDIAHSKIYEFDFEDSDFEHDYEEVTPNPPLLDYKLDNDDIFKKALFIRSDCKLSGCDENCRRTHVPHFDPESDIENMVFLPMCEMIKFHKPVDSDDSDNYDNSQEYHDVQPYTPNSDHSYSQPMPSIKEEPHDSYSDTDGTDNDADNEDVTKELPQETPPKRRQYTRRKPYNKTVTITVKAAATALKRTRNQSRNTTKKQKMNADETPTSSSPSSRDNSVSRYSSDEEDEKRTFHNISERRRREAQKIELQQLRLSIPQLVEKPKSSKVLIINTAIELINELEQEDARLNYEMALAKKKNRKLQHKLLKKMKKYNKKFQIP